MTNFLLADDHATTCSALVLLIHARLGESNISTVGDWERLLELACSEQPDIILFDWELPGGPPAERMGALREIASQAKVIALSARPEAEKEASQCCGIDAFIGKSEPPSIVLETIRRFVQKDPVA